MLPVLSAEPFDSPEHIFEPRWDGLRCLAFVEDGQVRLQGRRKASLTPQFPEFGELKHLLREAPAVIDGEIVIADQHGQPDLLEVQRRASLQDPDEIKKAALQRPALFHAFDVLFRRGQPVLRDSLVRRKRHLLEMLQQTDYLFIPGSIEREGLAFFDTIIEKRLEGMVAKYRYGEYLPGVRSPDWIEIRCGQRWEFVVGAYSLNRANLSLQLGLYDGSAFVYCGSVSAGFNPELRRLLQERLAALETTCMPFSAAVSRRPGTRWVQPEVVVSVSYADWDEGGELRLPSLVCLRPDIAPADCTLPMQPSGGPSPTRRGSLVLLRPLPL